jgi:hypothetical protein
VYAAQIHTTSTLIPAAVAIEGCLLGGTTGAAAGLGAGSHPLLSGETVAGVTTPPGVVLVVPPCAPPLGDRGPVLPRRNASQGSLSKSVTLLLEERIC